MPVNKCRIGIAVSERRLGMELEMSGAVDMDCSSGDGGEQAKG